MLAARFDAAFIRDAMPSFEPGGQLELSPAPRPTAAVLILGYEWMKVGEGQSLGRVTTYETPLTPGLNLGVSRPATKEELIGFFGQLEGELERLGFFNPPHRRATVVDNVRTMFSRMGATEQEVRTLRGIVATLAKGKGRGRKQQE